MDEKSLEQNTLELIHKVGMVNVKEKTFRNCNDLRARTYAMMTLKNQQRTDEPVVHVSEEDFTSDDITESSTTKKKKASPRS